MGQRPIAEGLFTWPDEEPKLLGSRCGACAVVTFPRQEGCPRCGADAMVRTALPRRGTLWTWTTQGFKPKAPYRGEEPEEAFVPYAVGYVELGDVVRVEARLTEADPERLRIGMPMELVVVPFRTDDDGDEILMYAFAPVEEHDREETAS